MFIHIMCIKKIGSIYKKAKTHLNKEQSMTMPNLFPLSWLCPQNKIEYKTWNPLNQLVDVYYELCSIDYS